MVFRVGWTDVALLDLKEAVDYIALDDPKPAKAIGEEILGVATLLESFPCLGPKLKQPTSVPVFQINAAKDYRVFYRVEKSQKFVEILRVLHGSRDLPDF